MDFLRFSFAVIAVLALIACDSGSSSGFDVAESSGLEGTSSGAFVSSSSVGSSSTGAWSYLNPAISYGEFTDPRDNQVYKTVVIGSQTWMAQNLNYAVDTSWCYENSADSCAKYGRLYLWKTAARFTEDDGSDGHYQGVCPAGWHLPSAREWDILYDYVDDHNGSEGICTSLKSMNGWYNDADTLLGTDLFGFSALPGGKRNDAGSFFYTGLTAFFWSSTVSNGYYDPYSIGLGHNVEQVGYSYNSLDYAYSVRCLKDAE